MTDLQENAAGHTLKLPVVSTASVLLGFTLLQLVAFLNAGVFEYPLDDVYIHLAISEQIAHGGYGVNSGEYASAASSPLYPVFLILFAGAEAQRFLPLIWNIVALTACGWLWGRILSQAGYETASRSFGIFAAAVVPLLINLPGIAYTGMEHTLHTAASLAIVLGLLILLDEDRLTFLLPLGIVLGPAIRFEALGLSLLAAGVLVLRRRSAAGIASGATALLVIVGFMVFLVSLGLEPLPSSVQAKLGMNESSTPAGGIIGNVLEMASHPNGAILFSILLSSIVFLVVAVMEPGRDVGPYRWLLAVIVCALVAHIMVGKVGWMNRYENYIVVSATAISLAFAVRGSVVWRLVALVPIFVATVVYGAHHISTYPYATRTIDRQQAQLARLAQDFVRGPVAVTDLGRVAWGNSHYVLDLWGLGSLEALRLRQEGAPPGWGGPLAARHDVELAMIFEPWMKSAAAPDWVRLGTLGIDGSFRYSLMPEVVIVATSSDAAVRLRETVTDWAAGLPEGAWFHPASADL
ncbi:hypothetical protein [Tropicimonas isoalkanivorans]|uniref:4-amino-4-deoxy-L-arabinose transferase n=1 Tax=Tropicimonas isoalkanivorans TaxID=441112 RepID=A0A1I1JF27_9RHOB|nr:hypothetical protein [Tropicimonas isoalkanivorans]SFC47134.1 hypothetical protein SAMN04488094_10595 [Tropicimonas isoalkanivorans]